MSDRPLLGHVIALLRLLQIKIPNATSITATTRNSSPILLVIFRKMARVIVPRINSIAKNVITEMVERLFGIKLVLKEARKATLITRERILHKAPNRKSPHLLSLSLV